MSAICKNQYTKMFSRDGKIVGEIKNLHSRPCPMAGCKGHRIHVLWPDGKSTYPCSNGCKEIDPNTLQIL